MATLLEIYTIEANAQVDPDGAAGDVLAAIQLRQRIRTAVVKRANTLLQTSLPTDADARSAALELLAWAQRTVQSPDQAAVVVLRLVLAANSGATVAQILAATDNAIETAIQPALALLAKGMHPGR